MKTLLLIALPLFAADHTEEKLADALTKANRAVAHAHAKSQEAGSRLNAYCQERGQIAGVRNTDGLWGCVNPQPEPPKPKAEEPKPAVQPAKPKDK